MKRNLLILLVASMALTTLSLGCGDGGNGGGGGTNNGGNNSQNNNNGGNNSQNNNNNNTTPAKPKEGEPCTATLACDTGLTCVLISNGDPQVGVCTKFTGSTCQDQAGCSGDTPNCITFTDLSLGEQKSVCAKSCTESMSCTDDKFACIGEKSSHYRSGTCQKSCSGDNECTTGSKTKCEGLSITIDSDSRRYWQVCVDPDPTKTPEIRLNTTCGTSSGNGLCPADLLCAETHAGHGWCTLGCAKAMANAPDCPTAASTCVSMKVLKSATETEEKLVCVPPQYVPKP